MPTTQVGNDRLAYYTHTGQILLKHPRSSTLPFCHPNRRYRSVKNMNMPDLHPQQQPIAWTYMPRASSLVSCQREGEKMALLQAQHKRIVFRRCQTVPINGHLWQSMAPTASIACYLCYECDVCVCARHYLSIRDEAASGKSAHAVRHSENSVTLSWPISAQSSSHSVQCRSLVHSSIASDVIS